MAVEEEEDLCKPDECKLIPIHRVFPHKQLVDGVCTELVCTRAFVPQGATKANVAAAMSFEAIKDGFALETKAKMPKGIAEVGVCCKQHEDEAES